MKFLSGAGSAVLPASMSLPKPKVLVITGPTAVGKTQISLKLAKELGGEIISADSIQVSQRLGCRISRASRTYIDLYTLLNRLVTLSMYHIILSISFFP